MSVQQEVDPSNEAQRDNWDGATGQFWTAHAAEFDRGVSAYRTRFLDAAAITADAQVLGNGVSSVVAQEFQPPSSAWGAWST